MQSLTYFLTHLQTFELRLKTKGELNKFVKKEYQMWAYSLSHETQYYDSFAYKSEIRVSKDMALVDLLALNEISLNRELEQLKKLKARFKLFWKSFLDITV
jgi:hypothetical protein